MRLPIPALHPATSFEALRAIGSQCAPVALGSAGVSEAIRLGLVTHCPVRCAYRVTAEGARLLRETTDVILP